MKKFTLFLFLLPLTIITAQEKIKDTLKLDQVEIKKEKKAIEQKADRTIFDFAGQSYLNSGSVIEGLKKLPGLIVSDVSVMRD